MPTSGDAAVMKRTQMQGIDAHTMPKMGMRGHQNGVVARSDLIYSEHQEDFRSKSDAPVTAPTVAGAVLFKPLGWWKSACP